MSKFRFVTSRSNLGCANLSLQLKRQKGEKMDLIFAVFCCFFHGGVGVFIVGISFFEITWLAVLYCCRNVISVIIMWSHVTHEMFTVAVSGSLKFARAREDETAKSHPFVGLRPQISSFHFILLF